MRGCVRTWLAVCLVALASCGEGTAQRSTPAPAGSLPQVSSAPEDCDGSGAESSAGGAASPGRTAFAGATSSPAETAGSSFDAGRERPSPPLESGIALQDLRMDSAFAGRVLGQVDGGAESADLLRLYAENDWYPLFADPHLSSLVTTRLLKFVLATHELGLDPHGLWFDEMLKASRGTCRVRFFADGDQLAELEEAIARFVPSPPLPHLGLACEENWLPRGESARKLDVLLGLAYVRLARILSLDATAPERADVLFPGAERAVPYLVSLLPPNHRYFGRVAALRNLLPYWSTDTFPVIGQWGSLRKGDIGPRVERLKRRLVAEGYMTPKAATAGRKLFDNEMRRAVLAYRAAYGLTSTGKVGPEMLAWVSRDAGTYLKVLWRSLNTTLVEGRERQSTYILVNVPEFATHFVENGRAVASYRSIVGFPYEEPGGRTPVLSSLVEYIDFNPTWTPTPWVLENELQRKARKTPHYFADNHFERRNGKWVQTPGPHNTLGQVVVVFPNDNLVRLHGTNEPRRFDYRDRALSHGCVRVENIEDLAMRVLKYSDIELALPWETVISQVIEKRIAPTRRIPVHILYDRVHVAQGRAIAITPDPYNLDRRLAGKVDLDPIYRLVTRARKSRRLAKN